jgi:hypothetical protein
VFIVVVVVAVYFVIDSVRKLLHTPSYVRHWHHGMGRPRAADGRHGIEIWRVALNILNKQSRIADKV